MKFTTLALVPLLLTSFVLVSCSSGVITELNSSSMYAPPVLTFLKDTDYQMKEGKVRFRKDQRFYSQFELSRILIHSNLK